MVPVGMEIIPKWVTKPPTRVSKFQAGDLGPYGNYSGSCALRPVNGDQTKNVMCFPNEARALEFGDILWIYRVNVNENATGSDIYWSVNLLSSDFKALFHLSVRPRAEKYGFVALNNNNGQWLNGKWGVEESHAIEFNLGEASEIRIENTPEALKVSFIVWIREIALQISDQSKN